MKLVQVGWSPAFQFPLPITQWSGANSNCELRTASLAAPIADCTGVSHCLHTFAYLYTYVCTYIYSTLVGCRRHRVVCCVYLQKKIDNYIETIDTLVAAQRNTLALSAYDLFQLLFVLSDHVLCLVFVKWNVDCRLTNCLVRVGLE